MLTIGQIEDVEKHKEDYDEIWWIVHSPQEEPTDIRIKIVPQLAPGDGLFCRYREAYHAGIYDINYFETVYAPQFLKELRNNSEALNILSSLCDEASKKDIVLCCYCQDEKICHRSIIAGVLLGMGADIRADKKYLRYYQMLACVFRDGSF